MLEREDSEHFRPVSLEVRRGWRRRYVCEPLRLSKPACRKEILLTANPFKLWTLFSSVVMANPGDVQAQQTSERSFNRCAWHRATSNCAFRQDRTRRERATGCQEGAIDGRVLTQTSLVNKPEHDKFLDTNKLFDGQAQQCEVQPHACTSRPFRATHLIFWSSSLQLGKVYVALAATASHATIAIGSFCTDCRS